jgi:hypothetical protein
MDTENDIADAVGVTEHPGQESAAEVAGELAPPTNAQQPVQGLDGDAYADDAAHMAAAGAPAPDGLATAGAEHMATDAYQPTAEEYAAYYQQHADHYQQEGMAAPDEDADAHALTSLYTVEDGEHRCIANTYRWPVDLHTQNRLQAAPRPRLAARAWRGAPAVIPPGAPGSARRRAPKRPPAAVVCCCR